MSTTVRIKRMYPALSAMERVLLTLEDRKARAVDDPFILGTTPQDQVREVNRLFHDVGIVNHELGGVVLALLEATRAAEWRWRWFEAMAAHAGDLDLVHARPRSRRIVRARRKSIARLCDQRARRRGSLHRLGRRARRQDRRL